MSARTIPDFDGFRDVAGQGNVVPIYRELLVDRDTPVSAFLKLGGGPQSFLLESMEGGEKWGRYSMIGGRHSKVFTLRSSQAVVTDPAGNEIERRDGGHPLGLLQDLLDRDRPVHVQGLPRLSGGAIGFVGYDVVRRLERLPGGGRDDIGLPTAGFIFFDSLVIFDNLRHTVKVVANARVRGDLRGAYREAVEKIDELASKLAAPAPAVPGPAAGGAVAEFVSDVGRERYLRGVEAIREYIRAGDVFQTVLAHRLETETTCRPFDAYRALRVTNPSPYMFYLDFGDFQIAGSSPEVLVRAERGSAQVRPIAGTRRRGRSEDEDRLLEEELLRDEKERSEHLMLVDLGRNDLGRVSLYGTVRTDEFMVIERYSHVMHIVSNVRGTLRPDVRNVDVLSACFPAGTVSGAPKVRAMEIIDELEPHRRGVYAGAVGYFDYHGNLDACIAIRTITFAKGRAYVGVGAGIVADSQPEREWEETMAKSRAMTEAVYMAERGLDVLEGDAS
jgi:anthranilate synthase component 1